MGFFEFLTVIASFIFVGWLAWSRRENRNHRELDATESEQLEELNRLAESMAERIKNLETILDAEQPEWRDYDEKN